MARKRTKETVKDLHETLAGGLPPVFAGPPSWAPVGYVCRLEDVVEILIHGHKRATAKDRAAFAAEWNATPRQSPPPPAPAPTGHPTGHAAPTSPHEPIDIPAIDRSEQEYRREQAKLAEAWARDTRPDDPSDEARRQTVARG
jgi:hypothetical protein